MERHERALGVKEIIPRRFGEARGNKEARKRQRLFDIGIDIFWFQKNHYLSADKSSLRDFVLQVRPAKPCKVVRVLKDNIFDVTGYVRPGLLTLRTRVSCTLSTDAFNQLYMLVGFSHDFLMLNSVIEEFYKLFALYTPACGFGMMSNDEDVAIDWPLPKGEQPILSEKVRFAMLVGHFASHD